MNVVNFPGLGLEFEISKIAFNIAGIDIYNYAICIVLGILTGLLLCKTSEEKYYIKFDYVLETILFVLVFGILGARLYYVIFNFNYYTENIVQILNFRDGGLAIYGGIITGLYVIVKRCQKCNVNTLDFLNYISPYVAIAQSIGRWGNFFNIEAYGSQTKSLFRMGIFNNYNYIEVHPVFLYESILTFVIFLILKNCQSNKTTKNQIFYLYILLYSGVRMFLESLRVDSLMFLAPFAYGLTTAGSNANTS